MRTFYNAKSMAKARGRRSRRGIQLQHSECLEIAAREFELGNWNILAARPRNAAAAGNAQSALVLPAGRFLGGSKPDAASGVATIWMRVDGAVHGQTLAFDNMEDKTVDGPLTGTRD